MGIWELLLIAVGLSMDAAAVSMSNGMCFHRAGVKEAGRIAGAFGIFQGIMPLIGYYACSFFERESTSLDHWVALILLGFIGGKMIWESHAGHEVSHECVTLSGKLLFMQAIATSIDALAVGVSFVALPYEGGILAAASVICAITFAVSFGAVFLGRRFGGILRNKAEFVGGLILVGIGVKIFIEHMLTG